MEEPNKGGRQNPPPQINQAATKGFRHFLEYLRIPESPRMASARARKMRCGPSLSSPVCGTSMVSSDESEDPKDPEDAGGTTS